MRRRRCRRLMTDAGATGDRGARAPARRRARKAEIVAFRTPGGSHRACRAGGRQRDGKPPLVRLHSECLTGDVLGSLKCDCGPQLHAALGAIADAPAGACCSICGRKGAGSASSTSCAPMRCRIRASTRSTRTSGSAFRSTRAISRWPRGCSSCSNIPRIRLLTNNPEKVAGLEREGVEVVERMPLALPTNKYNEQYLATKRDRTGHQL